MRCEVNHTRQPQDLSGGGETDEGAMASNDAMAHQIRWQAAGEKCSDDPRETSEFL